MNSIAEHAAENERRLLQTYCVTLASQRHGRVPPSTDRTSSEILINYHPVMREVYRPLSSSGDGNCLYRSVSLSMTNTQSHHLLVRLLTAIELILNKSFYDHKSFLDEDVIVTSQFPKLLNDTIMVGSFSELAHIYAISAAIRLPINSYYPPQLYLRSSGPLTREVFGRGVRKDLIPDICVMWTKMRLPPDSSDFVSDHFVCLVKESEGRIDRLDSIYNSEKVSNSDTDNSASIIFDNEDIIDGVRVPHVEDCVKSSCFVEPIQLENSMANYGKRSEMSEAFSPENVMPTSDWYPSDKSGQLDSGCFLDTKTTIQLLTHSSVGLPSVPAGRKENCYFVIENGDNSSKRAGGRRSNFIDDCGVWDGSKGSSPKTYFLIGTDETLQAVFWRNGMFCKKRRIQGKVEYLPMEPQPSKDRIAVVQRYYTKLKLDASYKKRVTWLSEVGIVNGLAVVEYVGKYPGLAPHGNSRIPNSEFVRTPAHVTEKSNELATEMPSEVFGILTNKFDEITRSVSIQQVKDRKRQMSKASSANQGPSRNVADLTDYLDDMVAHDLPFVRSIIQISNNSHSVVLYAEGQLQTTTLHKPHQNKRKRVELQ
ncbi:hypothetical protein MAR_017070 [Mya arenaria]|uniref:OTU domain-containing protein n=1 Tax=Mya arenaria TaxID=6604 RepID=A0ABY7EDV4_MYAAR|nr:hypothetical protein MAR_017070 [Mya arenaria]